MLLCFFASLIKGYSQEECGFETPLNYQTYEGSLVNRSANETYCINVCFRILRDNDGSNAAINPSIIPQILTKINSYFNPHGIYFKQIGTYDYINNTAYNNRIPGTIPSNIPNCINLYFIKSFGTTSNIAGIAEAENLRARILGSQVLNSTTSHELGHIFNLLHTFSCNSSSDNCIPESPYNTEGCEIKGDKICDTPADYNPTVSNPNPPYPINSYNPDKTNIMSYWSSKNKFSIGQGIRMKSAIVSAAYLQSVRSYDCAIVVGPSRLCPGKSANYYVSGATFGSPTFNWNVNSNLQINGPSNSSSINITKTNLTGGSNITVTINGNIIKTKKVKCLWFARLVGLYDWISTDSENMGFIAPIDLEVTDEEDPTIAYSWEIKENNNSGYNCEEGTKAYFVGSSSNAIFLETNTNQAVVNWGNCTNSYLITCHEITQSGERFLISENYVDVGDPKNNPCFKNAFQTIIAPNPVKNGEINVVVNKPDNTTPCNYKNLEEPQYFNSELDRINNSVTVFDYYGNQIYANVFESNEFTIENLPLQSGNNYAVNLFTNEGGFSQRVIIAEL